MDGKTINRTWPLLGAVLVLLSSHFVSIFHDRTFAYGLAGSVLIAGCLLNRRTLEFDRLDLLYYVTILSLIFVTAINGRLLPSNLSHALFFFCGFLYFRSCESTAEHKSLIVAFAIINSALILFQQIKLLPVHGLLDKYGFFENSGYASLVCAFAIGIVLEENRRWRIPLAILLAVAPVLLLSRTAVIAITLVLLYDILKTYGKKTRIIVLAITTAVCLAALYYLKPLSADSRLLTWVSISNYIVDNGTWFGKGLGSVARDYMFMQKDFLVSHPESSLRMIADNNYQVYNDYLRVLYEGGLFTFALWIAFIASAAAKSLKSGKILFVIPIVAMFFMNVMDIPVVALLSILSLTDYPKDGTRLNFSVSSKAFCIPVATAVLAIVAIHGFNRNTEQGKMKEFRPAMAYARQLNNSVSLQNIEKVKEIIRNTGCTYEMLTDLSECQLQSGDTSGAISSLELAYNMVPNKVVACSALLNIYETQRDTANMKKMAKYIIDGEFKLKGSLYFEARKKARELLD